MLYRGSIAFVALVVQACAQPAGNGAGVDAHALSPADASAHDGAFVASDGPPASIDGPPATGGGDGAPMRRPCVEQLGTGLSTSYGRLDGFLVAIVPPGGSACHADSDHVHLQILMHDQTYDVAVNVGVQAQDVHTTTRELALPVWSEGWHTGVTEDYATLGVHSTAIPLQTSAQIISALDGDLATVNHISIFATGYGPDGAHLVHHDGGGHDGLIVTQPLSSPAHARLFSFTSQSF